MACPVCGLSPPAAAQWCPSCGADLTALAPGSLLGGRYEVRGLLGRGGMAAVYRAFDRVLRLEIALKVQRADSAHDPSADSRFRNEVLLARQVTHPRVCRLYDGGQEGERRWISMELVSGETVADRLARTPPRQDEAWDLALQAAEGLAAVHRAGVVHRDLKPHNLMLDAQGGVRLMDFGIARTVADGRGSGGASDVVGSPEYMSPEQARGLAADARSDVYALGVVLFELFTGHVPFRAKTPVATLLRHLEATPPLDELPRSLRPVLRRALEKDPARRYADGGALLEALRHAREERPAPRKPRMRFRVATALAVAAAGTAVALLLRTVPAHGPVPTPSPAARAVSVVPTPAVGPTPQPAAFEAAAALATPPHTARPRPAPIGSAAGPAPPPATVPVVPASETPSPSPKPEAPPASTVAPVAASPAPTPIVNGSLLVVAKPWADVSVDGIPRGQTPLGRMALAPGPHAVLLTHPDYQPYPRRVTIRPGETTRLAIDLAQDGVRRR